MCDKVLICSSLHFPKQDNEYPHCRAVMRFQWITTCKVLRTVPGAEQVLMVKTTFCFLFLPHKQKPSFVRNGNAQQKEPFPSLPYSQKGPCGIVLQWATSQSCSTGPKRGVNSANICPITLPIALDYISDVIMWLQKLEDQENYTDLSSYNREPLNPYHWQPSSVAVLQWGEKGQPLTG